MNSTLDGGEGMNAHTNSHGTSRAVAFQVRVWLATY